MSRGPRITPAGMAFHILNRSVGRSLLFRNHGDYSAFEYAMLESFKRVPLRILSYCLMPNHWHFVVWPRQDNEISAYFRWLTNTHAMRWRTFTQSVGEGPVYQGRFKSFAIQQDEHLLTVCRYVERNAVNADLADRAENWRWGSAWSRLQADNSPIAQILSEWPIDRPADWLDTVNTPLTRKELERLEISEKRSRPYGKSQWTTQIASRLQVTSSLKPPGRPSRPTTATY